MASYRHSRSAATQILLGAAWLLGLGLIVGIGMATIILGLVWAATP